MAYTAQQAISKIKALTTMQHLKAEEFCCEDGCAHGPVKEFKDKLKPTQLRKVFNDLIAIELRRKAKGEFRRDDLFLILPKLAYAYGRKLIPEDFYSLMKHCIDRVKDVEDFDRFIEYIRAIMAYHKFEERRKEKGGKQ
jgi:CRISPR-associated protein Csm2